MVRYKPGLLVAFLLASWISLCRADADVKHYYKRPSSVPKFMPTPTNITVHEGELAVLKCKIYNLGPKLVFWRRSSDEFPLTVGEETFSPDRRYSVSFVEISEMESHWDLNIRDVRPKHAGTYECQISATETYTYSVTLNVLDPITYVPQLSMTGTQYVSLLADIHLVCNATGAQKAPEDVDWFFNGNRIQDSSSSKWHGRLQILKHKPVPGRSYISELIVSSARMSDRGHYVCRSSDSDAKGMKVHVLNDMNDRDDPKRNSGTEKLGHSSDKSDATSIHGYIVTTLLAYVISSQMR